MSGWVGKLLAECKADLTAHDDDNRVPIAAGARVQSFFFSGSGDREQPEPNGTDGLDENVDGQFYPGKLHDSDDGPTPFRVVFDDGDEEPVRRGTRRICALGAPERHQRSNERCAAPPLRRGRLSCPPVARGALITKSVRLRATKGDLLP